MTTETKGDIIKSYGYDNISNRTSFDITSNSSQLMSLTYAYDNLNRLSSVTDGTDTASYTYDANSNELTASLNGEVYKSSEYNYANLPTIVYFPNTGDSTNRIIYTYRVNGNMHSHKDWLDYTSARIYTYDGAGRVTMDMSMLDDDLYRDDFTYDTRGNIVSVEHRDRSVSPNVITTTDYTYDKGNKLLSSTDGADTTSYSYDLLGNMTSVTKNGEQIKAYTYDRFNRLSSSIVNGVIASYTYDGDNLRQTKTSNGITTQHILDGMNVVADIQGADTTAFIRGNGLVFSKNLSTGNRTVYNTYSKGDVAQLVQPDGTFTEYTYTAYGKIKYNTTNNTNPFTYCGEYTDTETGLVYLRNRYYDPELGRFLTQDPIKDGLNWYAYCENNPVNFVDPWGLENETDAINFGENSLKYKILVALGNLYRKNDDEFARAKLHETAEFIRKIEINESDYGKALKQLSSETLIDSKTGEFTRDICDTVTREEFVLSYLAYTKTPDFEKSFDGGMAVEVNVGNYYNIDMVCFVEDTKISTVSGKENIQDISVGDLVYSKNVENDNILLKPVVRTFENYTTELVHIYIGNETISTTPTHPFWVNGQRWKKSSELTTEDVLLSKTGEKIKIDSIEYESLEQPIKVYNFEVADYHTYFVDDTEILVHNRCLTNKEAAQAAAALGYTEFAGRTDKFKTPVYTNGKNYITIDKTEHGVLNTDRYQWKMATSKEKLDAGKYMTTDEYLNEIRRK